MANAQVEDQRDRRAIVQTRSGEELHGRIVGFDRETIKLAVDPSGSVVVLTNDEVVRVLYPPPPPPPPSPLPGIASAIATQPPERERSFGLQLGVAPGIDLDVDHHRFYAFGNVSVVMPAATGGHFVALSFGAGVNLRVSKRWKIELFSFLAPTRFQGDGENGDPWLAAIGVGIGMHYTAPSGFAVGFKLPLIGYAVGTGSGAASDGIVFFYLSSAMALPIGSIGYRF